MPKRIMVMKIDVEKRPVQVPFSLQSDHVPRIDEWHVMSLTARHITRWGTDGKERSSLWTHRMPSQGLSPVAITKFWTGFGLAEGLFVPFATTPHPIMSPWHGECHPFGAAKRRLDTHPEGLSASTAQPSVTHQGGGSSPRTRPIQSDGGVLGVTRGRR